MTVAGSMAQMILDIPDFSTKAAVNGNICVSFLQPFSERLYYGALLEELKENGIPYRECGTAPVSVAEIRTGE
jgi:hypothetical protein